MIVVDASVAVKWFVPEADHRSAIDLLGSGLDLIAPDLIIAETMHALRKKLRAGDMAREQNVRAGADLPGYLDEIVPSAHLIDQAVTLSIRLDHGFYDCVYLALALSSDARFVTADETFASKAAAAGFSTAIQTLTSLGASDTTTAGA